MASFEFALEMNAEMPILLTGAFLPQAFHLESLLYYTGGAAAPVVNDYPQEEAFAASDAAIAQFKTLCEKNNMEYRIHEEPGEELSPALLKETRYADLALISNDVLSGNPNNDLFEGYLKTLLRHTECPVVLMPAKFHKASNVLLAYDGSSSSVYAIRQFAALFPALSKLPALLFYMHPDKSTLLPDMDFIEELAGRHFSDLTIFKAPVSSNAHLAPWLEGQAGSMLVAGSKGRSMLSETLHPSFIQEIIRAHELPVFIAHK